MTAHRKHFSFSKPLLSASAAGAFFCASAWPAFAQYPLVVDSGSPAPYSVSQEPLRLPGFGGDVRPLQSEAHAVELTAGQTLAQSNGQQAPQQKSDIQRQLEALYERDGRVMPQMNMGSGGAVRQMPTQGQPQQSPPPAAPRQGQAIQAYATPGAERAAQLQSNEDDESEGALISLMGRLKRSLRGKSSNSPPADPGMNYPKAKNHQEARRSPQQQPNQQPSKGSIVPPAVPGVVNAPSTPPAMQPGLFPSTTGANPLPDAPQAPAAPANVVSNPLAFPPAQAPVQPEATFKPPVAPQVQVAERPSESVSSPSIPVLDFKAPIEKPAPTAPVEQRTAALPPAPSVAQERGLDEFFPADASRSAPVPAPAPTGSMNAPDEAVADVPQEAQPYTGLTLDDVPMLDANDPTPVPEPSEYANTDTTIKSPPSLKLEPAPALPSAPPTLAKESQPAAPPAALHPAKEKPALSAAQNREESKMERIASRKHLKGFKGFCPVVLREDRELVDSSDEFSVIYDGVRYEFSSSAAMNLFLDNPTKYAPAERGRDVIHLALTGEDAEGSLDYAVWYKGRLYLFSGVETMETFVAAPSSHVVGK